MRHQCNLAAKESGLECACMNNDDFTVLVGEVYAIEWACVLCGHCIQNNWLEQQIFIKLFIKLEHSSKDIVWMIQKAAAMGSWWLAASSRQHAHSCFTSCAEFFGETSNHPGDSAPLQSRSGTLQLLTFPKTKITFEREEISDCWWEFRKIRWGSWWQLGELCEVPRCLLWRALRCHPVYSVSCILCLLQ